MNVIFLLFLCFLMFGFLFLLSYYAPKYKTVIFMVRYREDDQDANALINTFRDISLTSAILIFVITFFLGINSRGLYFLSANLSLYITLIIYLFFQFHRKTSEIRQMNSNADALCQKKSPEPFRIKIRHCSLQAFLLFLLFYYSAQNIEQSDIINLKVYILPATAVFISGAILLSVVLIKAAPPLNTEYIKIHMHNFCYALSLCAILFLFLIQGILFFAPDADGISVAVSVILILFVFVTYYLRYIKKINLPYGFKIENPAKRLKDKHVITTSLDGTRVILNLSDRRSYFILAGFFIYIILYIVIITML